MTKSPKNALDDIDPNTEVCIYVMVYDFVNSDILTCYMQRYSVDLHAYQPTPAHAPFRKLHGPWPHPWGSLNIRPYQPFCLGLGKEWDSNIVT